MSLLKGFVGIFSVMIAGVMFLFITGTLSEGIVYAGFWLRIILILAVLCGSFFCGWGLKKGFLRTSLYLSGISGLLIIFTFFWFVPQLWDSVLILKLLGGLVSLTLFGVYLAGNLSMLNHKKTESN